MFTSCSACCRLPLGDLAPERFVRPRDRAPSPVQIDEHRDLRFEDVAVDRLGQVVDRAAVIAAQHVALVQHVRREEQDRHVARPPPLLDDLGELQAAHPRHLDVEDDRGELLIEQGEQRLVGRVRGHEPAPALRQERLERFEVARLVVDDQHARFVDVGRGVVGRRGRAGGVASVDVHVQPHEFTGAARPASARAAAQY
jgi:hypothetical protein